jgi:hypothetical protein
MLTSRSALLAVGTGLAALLAASGAQATYMGTVFSVTQAQAANAAPPIPGSAVPIANFVTTNDSLSFSSPPGAYTPMGFLANGGVTCNNIAAGGCGMTMNNTLWDITGTANVTNGQVFNFMHDDGITLTIAGQGSPVINAPGATPPHMDSGMFTGPTGVHAVELVYGEAFGPPAVLIGTLPTEVQVPEPASLALLGSALVGFGVWYRRRRTS